MPGYKRGSKSHKDDQLWRCKKTKKLEASYLLKMPPSSSFVDCGAHFGDTCLTMALHAKHNNRRDIKFFAFEPNDEKCLFIRNAAAENELKITVFNFALGEKPRLEAMRAVPPKRGRCEFDGATKYEVNEGNLNTGTDSDEEYISMTTLDTYKAQLGNVGFLHIDVEGWESRVLDGARRVLTSMCCEHGGVILAESFTEVSDAQITTSLFNMFGDAFFRLPDVVDTERNLLFETTP
ncbi:hypothetical protein ScalyP_jg2448 [Parmales sp. scaly parma]|nr:hypothetical protein ScalyP_jg2448 [Parmales sp. scaly parma]